MFPESMTIQILQSFPAAVILVDEDGLVRFFNNEALQIFGYSENEFNGKSVNDLIPVENKNHHTHYMNDFKTNPETRVMGKGREVFAVRKDNSKIPLEIGLRPFFFEEKLYILCVVIDITERREKEERMRKFEKMRSKFFMNISHEFRTPLTLIYSPLDQLLNNTESPELIKNLKIIKRNADRLYSMINQLMDIASLDFGIKKLQLRRISLYALLREIKVAFVSLCETLKISIILNNNGIAVSYFLDQEILEKIIVNLLTLAVKNADTDSEIVINCKDNQQGSIEIGIIYKGNKIDKSYIQKVAARDYVPENTEEGSVYRELSFAADLTQLHKGNLETRDYSDAGTEFCISLPTGSQVYNPADFAQGEAEISETLKITLNALAGVVKDKKQKYNEVKNQDSDGSKKLILVVDDNEDILYFVEKILQNDYRVIIAANGVDGLKQARELIPDVIISDIMMPDMDGIGFLKSIKTDVKTIHIPFILLTAKSEIDDRLAGLTQGADDYISKPFNARELVARVNNIIYTREILKQQYREKTIIKPAEITANSLDEEFLTRVMNIIEKNLEKPEFGVEDLASQVFLSSSQLYRKLSALTGYSPAAFIMVVRLQRAAYLISKQAGNMADIAFMAGFNSTAYFSKCFKDHFGCTPSQYAEKT